MKVSYDNMEEKEQNDLLKKGGGQNSLNGLDRSALGGKQKRRGQRTQLRSREISKRKRK